MNSRECFIPALRFTGFEDCWKEYRLGDFSQSIKRVVSDTQVHIMMITAQNGFINQSDRYSFNNAGESLKKYIELHKGELAYNHGASKLRPFGSCFSLQIDKARIPFVYHCFSIKENDPEFISLVLNNKGTEGQLRKIVTSGARMDGLLNISFEQYCSLNIKIPSLKEQQTIVDFFKSLDSMITLTSKKIEKLKQTLTGCMQTMFPQEGELEPKIRFKGFEGEWKSIPLKAFAKKKMEKNVGIKYNITLTNSAEYGVINQRDFFDHDISNSNSIGGYYIINNDDFVYNPRISITAPVGPINRNQLGYTGIMSPLYLIFSVAGINKDFLSYFFKTTLWYNYMKLNGNSGARFDRLAISDDDFFNMPIAVPLDSKEQLRIANYFKSLNEMISLLSKRLDLLKHIKSACLDNMFV